MIDARLCGQYKRQLYSLPPPPLSHFQFILFFLWIFVNLFFHYLLFFYLFCLCYLIVINKRRAALELTQGYLHIHIMRLTRTLFLLLSRSLPSRLFGTKCDKCGNSFSKNDFVMRAKTKIFHIECFRCSACARQLLPGMFNPPDPLSTPYINIYTLLQAMNSRYVMRAPCTARRITMCWRSRRRAASPPPPLRATTTLAVVTTTIPTLAITTIPANWVQCQVSDIECL